MSASPDLFANVTLARAEAAAARADLNATLGEIQTRLDPRRMAREAIDVARDRGEDLAERGVEFARERPGAAAGAVAATVALIAHRPLLRGIGRLFRRKPADPRILTDSPLPEPAGLPASKETSS